MPLLGESLGIQNTKFCMVCKINMICKSWVQQIVQRVSSTDKRYDEIFVIFGDDVFCECVGHTVRLQVAWHFFLPLFSGRALC